MKSNLRASRSLISSLFLILSLCLAGCNLLADDDDVLVRGYVWADCNKNGFIDEGEKGVSGIGVELYDQDGNLIDQATTDSGGYTFSGSERRAPGSYYVKFVFPQNYEAIAESGPIATKVNPISGFSDPFILNSAVQDPVQINLGLIPHGSEEEEACPEETTEGPVDNPPGSYEYTPQEDTVITSAFPDENYGDLDTIFVSEEAQAYLRFLITGDEYADVLSAVLTLYPDDSGHVGTQKVSISIPELKDSWDEGSLTWNNRINLMPGMPPFEQQLMQYTGPGSKDVFDITLLYKRYWELFPYAHGFDLILYLDTVEAENISQGWSSSEGLNPPTLNIMTAGP